MVLHLLGKKSWNVYNHDNIERVRKDEAEANAREEAAEQRMQEEDASRRIAILRGEAVPALPETQPDEEQHNHWSSRTDDYATRDRKRKRRHGEDDTDRDMRYARQDREVAEKARQTLSVEQIKKGGNVEAPLQDHAGHIQLFAPPDEKDLRARQKNEEAEAEKAKKRKREEDLVTMKFGNAAGYANGMQEPWYAAAGQKSKPVGTASRNEVMLAELKGKDVWGNEDPSRKHRETKRIVSSDPFAAMQSAQRQLKQSKKDRQEWETRQKAEMEQLKREQNRQRRNDNVDDLDGFSLDGPSKRQEDDERRTRHRHHHRRHRSRSRDGESGRRHWSRSEDRRHKRSGRSRSREREKQSSGNLHRG